MRVARFNGPGRPITIERVPDPEPRPDELLVRIERCGVCGSDVSMTSPGLFTYETGCRLGHESAGEVVEVGSEVGRFRPGDRITCMAAAGCGRCEACRDGLVLRCTDSLSLFGGFGDLLAVPEGAAVPLPRGLSYSDGALVEPVACGLHAFRAAGLRGGERVLVLGAGSMGLTAVYWARALGAGAIVAASRSDQRRELALTMGADAAHDVDDGDPAALERPLGGPPDIVVECVGKPGMLGQAIDRVRPGGTVISLGMCLQEERLIPGLCTFKEVRLVFSLGYSTSEFEETVRAFDGGHVRPELMVGEVIALEDLPDTIERMRSGASLRKVMVDPGLEVSRD